MGKLKFDEFRKAALDLGFSDLAYTGIGLEDKHLSAYKKWIERKMNGEMKYMDKQEAREKMDFLLKNANSVITLVTNYYYKPKKLEKNHAKIARYAFGRDHHKIIKKRLKVLENLLKTLFPEIETKSYVDTGPILERAYAEKAGLGFIGKNSCLITKKYGSFVFISEIITTLKIPEELVEKVETEQKFSICGSCNLCMQACPTGAIIAPGKIDSNKCISYLTIENKGKIPAELKGKIKESSYIYGCDICQEVCPHNACAKETKDAEFKKAIAGASLDIDEVLDIKNDDEFLKKFAGSPVMRAKRKGLQRNARVFKNDNGINE